MKPARIVLLNNKSPIVAVSDLGTRLARSAKVALRVIDFETAGGSLRFRSYSFFHRVMPKRPGRSQSSRNSIQGDRARVNRRWRQGTLTVNGEALFTHRTFPCPEAFAIGPRGSITILLRTVEFCSNSGALLRNNTLASLHAVSLMR